VLTTYVAGIPELVHHGETGWLFPAASVDELSMATETSLAKPIDLLERLADAGYRLVLERHSIDSETAKLAAYFREMR
jgi:colanic acid/amylovoran biosynthesis glycosyltransferase